MVDIFKIKDDIVKVMIFINVVSLIISCFASPKVLLIGVIILNVILSYTLIIISNVGNKFESQFNKMWGDN